MKKLFLTLLVLVLALGASAQKHKDQQRPEKIAIGIRVGGNIDSFKYTEYQAADTLDFDVFMKRVKPMIGVNVEIPLLNGIIYVAPEVGLSVRGDSRLFENAGVDTLVSYKAKVNYLEARLPISIAIPVSPNFKPYVFAAPSFGMAMPTIGPLKSEITQQSLDKGKTINNTVAVNAKNVAPYDYGLTAGAGFRFRFNFPTFSMLMKLEGGYYFGLGDTYSKYEQTGQVPAQNVQAYKISGKRLNRGPEAAITIAIPLDFHSGDDCFYWSDVYKDNKHRGMYGF